ncbi:uncharacterized protein PG986_014313 [Apiospora aurea]|uniref:Uncharacterized protein n=1 Tax=Apiospora aurea TaxID=335848 RepID=A0ABR1PSM5_9PEZI
MATSQSMQALGHLWKQTARNRPSSSSSQSTKTVRDDPVMAGVVTDFTGLDSRNCAISVQVISSNGCHPVENLIV